MIRTVTSLSQAHAWLFLSIGVLALACSTATLETDWTRPGTDRIDFDKVLVLALVKDEATRRVTEDEMVRHVEAMGEVEVLASYRLPGLALDEPDVAKAMLRQEGFDGAVALRLVASEQELNYVPGAYPDPYYGFFGYWDSYWGTAWWPRTPGYVTFDTVVQLETNVYSIEEDELLWSGRTQLRNPESISKAIGDAARVIGRSLAKKGLIG